MAKKTKRQIERDEQIYQLTTLVAGDFSLQEVLGNLDLYAWKFYGFMVCLICLQDEEAINFKMRIT